MKRFITFSVVVIAIVLGIIGAIRDQRSTVDGDVSGGLYVIASTSDMAKCAPVGKRMVFSAKDFERAMNMSEITSITIVSVPSAEEGSLCVGDVVLGAGNTVSRANLDLLNFRSGSTSTSQASFEFKVGDSAYVMVCNMYFINGENSAPTLSLEDERIFSVSTHQTVSVSGRVSAHDPDGDSIRFEVVKYARCGTLSFDGATGEYTYTPTGAYFGEDSFEFVAVDKYGNYSRSTKVSLSVEKLSTDVRYCDMDDNAAHNAALTMTELGIMSGSRIGSKTYFMPDVSVSRVDFLVMLMHAIGEDDVAPVFDTGFDDDAQIPEKMKSYVRRARQMGIISGSVNADGEYLFEPNREITRAEAAVMICNVIDAQMPLIKPTFSDSDDIPTWAGDAIYTLNHAGIMMPVGNAIGASSPLTRAQSAVMLVELMKYIN